MELKYYLKVIQRRFWVVAGTVAITLLVTVLGTLLIKPMYRASTTIRIASTSGSTINYSEYMYSDRLINTYLTIANNKSTLEQLQADLELMDEPEVIVESIPGTELLLITAEHRSPQTAANIANNLAKIMIAMEEALYGGGDRKPVDILNDQINQVSKELDAARKEYEQKSVEFEEGSEVLNALLETIDVKQNTYASLVSLQEQTRLREAVRANVLSIVEPARTPEKPFKPNWLINLCAGLLLGVIGGVGIAFLWEHLDESISTSEDLRKITQLSILSRIPKVKTEQMFINSRQDMPLPYLSAIHGLRASLLLQNGKAPVQVLMVSSAIPGEGKSTIVANLASSAAKSGKMTLVIDFDMRRPQQHKIFGFSNYSGLVQVIEGSVDWHDALKNAEIDNLRILTSGSILTDPTVLLTSSKLPGFIQEVRKYFEFILLDTPAVLAVPDTKLICHLADKTLLIVNQRVATRETVQAAREELDEAKAAVVGVVVNEARSNRRDYYYSYYQQEKEKTDSKLEDFLDDDE